MKTPFASVVRFKGMKTLALPRGISGAGLEKWLDERLDNKNLFYAIRIDGKFSRMQTRAVAAQEQPYRPLVEVVKTQAVSNFNVRLPRDEAFAKTDLSKDREHEFNKVEK